VTGTGNVTFGKKPKGTWESGKTTITITEAPQSGKIAVGQLISDGNSRIPAGTTITACSTTCNEVGSTLTISKATTGARTNREFNTGDVEVESGGPFEVGQTIEGPGIPANDTISAINGSILILSSLPTEEKAGASLAAGSKSVTGVTTTTGQLSNGETISGTGIQSGTTIGSFNEEAGTITLSKVATGSGGKVGLAADLGFDASGFVVAEALEKLSSIGAGNVSGFAEGSTSPVKREVTFQGKFTKTDVELLTCNGAGLTGTSPTCTVTTKFPGGPHAIGSITTSGEITRYPTAPSTTA
jgi:hypothetical protein